MEVEGKTKCMEETFDIDVDGLQHKPELDDDGRPKRRGTLVTASAHIITAVIGSGVLSLAWAVAQLGWVVGPAVLVAFSLVTWFCSSLLADCYRSPDPVHGKRNHTYRDAVRANLGGVKCRLCALAQYVNLIGVTVGYTITTAISMGAVKRSNCFHRNGHDAACDESNTINMIIFAAIQMDTLKSSPPENQVMKKASFIGVSTTTLFYMLCGILGYAAFGSHAPGNFLTGFGFYDPFWLIDIGNICIVIHLIGAYQVFCQPIYQFVEGWIRSRWPDNAFFTTEHVVSLPVVGDFPFSLFRLIWRTLYVILTVLVASIFPFFNDFLGLIGALSFWPLTVYFPVEMYMAKAQIRKFTVTWTWLNILSLACLAVSLVAACGSIQGLVHDVGNYRPFRV